MVASVTTFGAALWAGDTSLALATVAIAGALLGFLRYNFNPATIFLGDSGSLTVGFLPGCFGVIWSQKAATLLGMTAPAIALCAPFLEVAISVASLSARAPDFRSGPARHPSPAARSRADAEARSAGLVLRGGGRGGVLADGEHGDVRAGRRGPVVFGSAIGRVINDRVALRQFEDTLRSAAASADYWDIVTDTSRKLGINKVRIEIGGRVRVEHLGAAPDSECWRLRVPPGSHGVAEFSVPSGGRAHPADIVRRRLGAKGARLRVLGSGDTAVWRPSGELAKHG